MVSENSWSQDDLPPEIVISNVQCATKIEPFLEPLKIV